MKIKQHLHSIFTLINLFLGFLAIINTMAGHYYIACYIILAAGAFDSVDGKIARLVGIPTNFGKEIDSLADMVSFCLAPSILVYSLYTQNMPGLTGEIIASAPLIIGAIRLARFNTLTLDDNDDEEKSSFYSGLPIPMAAVCLSQFVVFTERTWEGSHGVAISTLVVLLLSAMMVSRAPIFCKIGNQSNQRET